MEAPETSEELLQMRCDHLVERNGLLRHVLSEIRRISAPEPDSCVHQWVLLHQAVDANTFMASMAQQGKVDPPVMYRFCTECRHIEGPECLPT